MAPDEIPIERQQVETKELRKQIDACIQEVERQGGFGTSRALSLVKTKLEEAKMWGGKRLEELDPTTYPKELADRAE